MIKLHNGYIFIKFSILSLISFSIGCATSGMHVTSEPTDADVFISKAGQPPIKVGKTPFIVSSNQIVGFGADVLELQIQKQGFQGEKILLPKSNLGLSTSFHFNLKPNDTKEAEECRMQDQALNEVSRAVAEMMNYIKRKNLADAARVGESIKLKYPNVAVVYDLLGNVYYLTHDIDKALLAYKKSKELNPNNFETERMIQKLSSLRVQKDEQKQKGGEL
jgi:hypothetical protein